MMASEFWLTVALIWGIGVITSLFRFPFIMTFVRITPNLHNEWEEDLDEFASKYTAMVILDLLPSLLSEAILLTIATIVGLLCAQSIHLRVPIIDALLSGKNVIASLQTVLLPGLWFGIGIGVALLLLERIFFRRRLRRIIHAAPTRWRLWKSLLASLHGSIALEILWRLFAFSLVAWILSRIWHTSTGEATFPVLWITNILLSSIAAIFYLRSAFFSSVGFTTYFSPLLFTRTFLLDGFLGCIFGYLFWHYGFEAALTAHLIPGILLQLCGGRPPLAKSAAKEIAEPLQEEFRKRTGIRVNSLRGTPRIEVSDLLVRRPKSR